MNLTNSWMNDPNFLAGMAHSGWAALITTWVFFTFGMPFYIAAVVLVVILAGIKEFWYDAKYELPAQTGLENFSDFCEYLLGLGLGGVLLYITHLLR